MDSGDGGKYGWKEISTNEAEVRKAVNDKIAKVKRVNEVQGPDTKQRSEPHLEDVHVE